MTMLPPELWIMILDMVIEEGIIRLDQCNHITFPYDYVVLSLREHSYRFYRSHCQLRLVCRSFNVLLGTGPHCNLHPWSLPLPISIRALRINAFYGADGPIFRRLLAETSRCERLVYLEVSCCLSTSENRPNLSDLLRAGTERSFPNIQRLALSLLKNRFLQRDPSFWARLHRAFPRLVTLVIEVNDGHLYLNNDTDVTFETLEILHLGTRISNLCRFPHLLHASLGACSQYTLEILKHSPHLESLLIRSLGVAIGINLRSFSRLRVLSICEDWLREVVPLDCDHPLEHLWLYSAGASRNPRLIEEILKRLPGVSRITMDISLISGDRRRQRAKELQRMKLDSFGLTMRPVQYGDSLFVIEPVAAVITADIAKDGIWKKVWRKMRR